MQVTTCFKRSWGGPVGYVLGLALSLLAAAEALARVDGDAIVGEPFGVGRVSFSAADVGGTIDELRLRIEERDGRIHYPAVTAGLVGPVLGQLIGEPQLGPRNATIHFLFRGEEPLRITLFGPTPREVVLAPRLPEEDLPPRRPRLRFRERARDFDGLLARWWRDYTNAARRQINAGDHPPLVQDYLTTMLAMRIGLDPLLIAEGPASDVQRSLELLAGTERLRRHMLQTTMLQRGDFGQPANLPVPLGPNWREPELPAVEQDVAIEPLAMHVPQECFYVRFGSFSNYLWLTRLTEDYGGDLASMVTLRSYFPDLNDRVQKQLGLEQNKLAELFGDRVIADVCLLGRDTFVQEGAAVGILFQARSTQVLGNDLTQQRRRALAREKERGSSEQTMEIGGRQVSFVSTPDNRLRSFHAVDGDFHLVTTSRAIVERFFAISEGDGSLGASAEFRHARSRMPLSREDTIFVYMSAPFFQGLLSPQYQIELKRRLESVTDIELVMLAQFAARGEGVRDESLESLAAEGFLPARFGRRPDGSGPIVTDEEIVDSLRGARGTFAPIADIQLANVTEAEADWYDELAEAYSRSWRQMDPLMVAVKRFALDKNGKERVTIDCVVAPLDEAKYGWVLALLGPPTREMISPAPGDVVNVQAAVRGGILSPQTPPHHLFLGIQDLPPDGGLAPRGFLQTFQMLRATPGYLGGWPRPGFLDLLPPAVGGSPPDEFGFSSLPLGLWKREGNGYAVLSFDPQLLAEVTPHLRVTQAEQEAQIRVHVGDLSQAKIADWVNRTYYQRAVQASEGNVRLLHLLNQQLHVPLEDCREVAEQLLGAELISPLGGDYELVEVDGGRIWQASAVAGSSPPAGYEAPLLTWFRGLDASLIKQEDQQILAHVQIDMQRKPAEEPRMDLPLFDLFRGATRAFVPKEKQEGDKPAEEPPALPPVPEEAKPRRAEF